MPGSKLTKRASCSGSAPDAVPFVRMLLLIACIALFHRFFPARPKPYRGQRFHPPPRQKLCARKPAWVVKEVVRLKALMGDAGCRTVADTFNRMHAAHRGMTVSKTWVATTVRLRRLEIDTRRREWKWRSPRPMEVNAVWGLDLTGKSDTSGTLHVVLGIVDHGTRLAAALQTLPDKASVTILRTLLDAIERHGRPKAIRTDNEAVFTSRLFRLVFAVLGIHHQRTALHCPWQNGRVERFFGTLKQKLDCWAVDGAAQLELALGDFRAWYNHVRPHQHLGGRTPAETWMGIDPYTSPPKQVSYFSAWDGMLTGFHIRR